MSATELTASSDGTDGGTTDAGTDAQDAGDGQRDARAREESTGHDSSADVASPPETLSKDVLFDILKNERRRQTLEFLREEPTTTLSDLAEHVAALENDKPIRELTSSERKRVYVGLYQCHLPKMDDAGVIDYERSRGTIRLRDAASPCFVYLDIELNGQSNDEGRISGLWSSLTSLLLRG